MTCRHCGHHYCWHCSGPLHGDSNFCTVLQISNSEVWGSGTVTRTVTKTIAFPFAVAAGGVAIGVAGKMPDSCPICMPNHVYNASGAAAGLAVAGGGILICASPFIGKL